jgi:hypothetical protein
MKPLCLSIKSWSEAEEIVVVVIMIVTIMGNGDEPEPAPEEPPEEPPDEIIPGQPPFG